MLFRLFGFFWGILSVSSLALAEVNDDLTSPVLRLETGVHSAAINKVVSDEKGHWLVTASDDKTARVWNAETGELLRVLRPPVGDKQEGELQALAMGRDGRIVAVGGFTRLAGGTIYLFDRSNGHMLRSITGMSGTVNDIAISGDGLWLAVALSSGGVRVFGVDSGKELGRDVDYAGKANSVDFSPDGKMLITTSSDELVRLYKVTASGLVKGRTHRPYEGSGFYKLYPNMAKFSSDGRNYVVGSESFDDKGDPSNGSLTIFRLNKKAMLGLPYLPDGEVTSSGRFKRVEWTKDGLGFYGLVSTTISNFAVIKRWNIRPKNEGRIEFDESDDVFGDVLSERYITHDLDDFSMLPGAKIAWAGHGGILGVLGNPGIEGKQKLSWVGTESMVGFRHLHSLDSGSVNLSVSKDATRILLSRVSIKEADEGKDSFIFDLKQLKSWRGKWEDNFTVADKATSDFLLDHVDGNRIFSFSSNEERFTTSAKLVDENMFVLGSTSRLVLQEQKVVDGNYQNKFLKSLYSPAPVYEVAASNDGRWVVAALGDGTIRWYRASDLKEMMALFVHMDQKRWVMWTPLGYYNASPGGEELIGWHQNNLVYPSIRQVIVNGTVSGSPAAKAGLKEGDILLEIDGRQITNTYLGLEQTVNGTKARFLILRDGKKLDVLLEPNDGRVGVFIGEKFDSIHESDFFPASRFRDRFYRPDVLTKIFATQDEASALQQANEESGRRTQTVSIAQVLPPVVEILSPVEGAQVSSNSITLRYNVRTDSPVTGIRVRVNGQTIPEVRGLGVTGGGNSSREVTVTIPEQNSEIQLFAENKNGVSVPATVRVTWAGKKAALVGEDNRFKPKLYVLAVGVSQYKNPDLNLGLPAKDASDFARVFEQQKGKLYGDVVVQLLTDEQASKDKVIEGLEWLKSQVTAKDVGVMFIAGHGMNDNQGKYFFMPYNANPDKLMSTGVAQTDIRDTLNSLAGKVLFFVDTCHAGNALGTGKTRGVGGSTDAFINELASAENGVIVFSSSTGRQLSQEDSKWGNGAFTKAVVEGLNGKAEINNSGKVTLKGLDYYVAERVKELTHGQQSPVSIAPGGITDFPIAVTGK